jgi:hypothetical protein
MGVNRPDELGFLRFIMSCAGTPGSFSCTIPNPPISVFPTIHRV